MLVKRSRFKLDVYGVNYILQFFSTNYAVGEFAAKHDPKYIDCHMAGVVTYDEGDPTKVTISYSLDKLTYNVIAHEVSHAVWATLELQSIGQDLYHENHANIEGFIFEKVMKFILKNNFKVK